MIHAFLHYTCKIFSEITHQTTLKEVRPNTAPFSSDVGLTKFVLASELFVPRPYFICHLTAKRFAKNLIAGSSIYSSKKVVKTGIKVENLKLHMFILNFSERASQWEILWSFCSLARVLQKVLGIGIFFIWFEVRFPNFAMNKANCDWLTLILSMVHLYQNKTINTLVVSAWRSQQVQVELGDSINTYGILYNTFQILDTENMSVMQIIPCLAILLKKSESDILNIVKKSTVDCLASIHFQLCFKYIMPCFAMLCHQILSLAMGLNFHVVHPCQP